MIIDLLAHVRDGQIFQLASVEGQTPSEVLDALGEIVDEDLASFSELEEHLDVLASR
jgi:hypothetical protein